MRRLFPSSSRRGHTLVELCLALTLIAIITSIATLTVMRQLDRAAVRAAVAEAAGVILRARDEAIAQHTPASVRFDTLTATLDLRVRGVVVFHVALGHAHGVSLSSTRDSLAYDVRGLGFGAANLTMVARRGAAADSLVVSRLGRVRW
jgi:Tfp pilus assembly protein FimT